MNTIRSLALSTQTCIALALYLPHSASSNRKRGKRKSREEGRACMHHRRTLMSVGNHDEPGEDGGRRGRKARKAAMPWFKVLGLGMITLWAIGLLVNMASLSSSAEGLLIGAQVRAEREEYLHREARTGPLWNGQHITSSVASLVPQWLSGEGRTLVVYVYFEKNQLYRDNLDLFLKVGVDDRDDIDYLFVVQGPSSISFPRQNNVRVLRKENDCLDFGGWRYGLDAVNWRGGDYQYFVFINSSVRGPFLPLYIPKSLHWTKIFTQLLREDGDGYADNGPIKLVGMTINCHFNRPHVQSMLWATDLETLQYLIDETQVVTCKKTMREAIDYGEIALSAKILARGWNIGSLAVAYRGWDFRVQRTCNGNRDPNWEGWYYGTSPGVHETIFVKTNRGFRRDEVETYTRIALQQAEFGKFDGAHLPARRKVI